MEPRREVPCAASEEDTSSFHKTLRARSALIHVTQISTGRNLVAHQLLEQLDFREPALLLARPYEFVLHAHLVNAANTIGNEGDSPEFLRESGEQLLGHPAGAQKPAAFSTIGDGQMGSRCHGRGFSAVMARRQWTTLSEYLKMPAESFGVGGILSKE